MPWVLTSPCSLNQKVAPSISPGRIRSLKVSSDFFSHLVPSNSLRLKRMYLPSQGSACHLRKVLELPPTAEEAAFSAANAALAAQLAGPNPFASNYYSDAWAHNYHSCLRSERHDHDGNHSSYYNANGPDYHC